jgi:hypothetical protein
MENRKSNAEGSPTLLPPGEVQEGDGASRFSIFGFRFPTCD